MPRKAGAALAVVPTLPGRGRPEPPAELDPVEQRIWREVIDALPGHWVDTAGQLVLRRLAAEAAVSESQEIRLRQLRAEGRDDTENAAELIAAHGAVAKIIAHLLTQLRATPYSRMRPRTAGSKLEGVPESRPWEIRAKTSAQTA
jgi:hypothetical protein